jgi:hypothetical protein
MDEVRHNIFEENIVPANEYYDLTIVVNFKDFKYDENYRQQEIDLLQPQLEALGYTDIKWGDGERDSFGPLTRTCTAKNRYGLVDHFFYGWETRVRS